MTLKDAIKQYERLTKRIDELEELDFKLRNDYGGPYQGDRVTLDIRWSQLQALRIAVSHWKKHCKECLDRDVLSNFEEDEDEQTDDHREPDERS